jgi:uncharacterized cupin superfamily protein
VECRRVLARLRRRQQRPPLDWAKGWAAASPDYYAIAVQDEIVDLVRSLLGEDVLLWGASLAVRRPGDVHRWHTDIESSSPAGETVSVWIGLAGTDARSSLKVVPRSHRFGVSLQQVLQEKGLHRAEVADGDVAGWARELDEESGVVPVPASDGEAIVFDGRLWHGSSNVRRVVTRSALLLQYASPRTPIRIPNLERLDWPFELFQAPRAPCIVVSGRDAEGVNRVVPAPVGRHESLAAVTSRIHPLALPLERDAETGWKQHLLFDGSTPDIAHMHCHVSVLDPGTTPHPLHRHPEEELLVVLDGEAELHLDDGLHRVRRGMFAYYPGRFGHTITNASPGPVAYLMFKWITDRGQARAPLSSAIVRFDGDRSTADRFATNAVLDGETTCLRHLNAHISTLVPGAGYEPHVDSYDVAIVTLEGTVETLGVRVGPNSVVFYAAGEPHGMQNVGDLPAVYLVFEFHGRHSKNLRADDTGFSRRLWRLVREPRQFRREVERRVRDVTRR